MKRKVIAMILSLAMCTGMLAGCGSKDSGEQKQTASVGGAPASENKDPLGKYDEPITVTSVLSFAEKPITCPDNITPEDNNFNKAAKERLNIDVKWLWTAPEDQYDQKLGVALASGEIPDVLVLNKAVDYQNLLENEQIMPWNDALEYASDSFKEWINRNPEVLKSVTTESGDLMALPQYWDPKRQVNIMMLRKDWLDELNLEVPKTVEELEVVAEAFMQKKGANIGIGLTKKVLQRDAGSMTTLLNMFGSYPGDWTEAADGTLTPGEISPNTKVALETLNRFYSKGILSKEFAIYDFTKLREEVLAEELGIAIGPFWAYDSLAGREIAKNEDSKWCVAPIPTAEGAKGAIMDEMSVEKYWVISSECKNPDAVIKLFNLWVDFETTFPEEAKAENGHAWNWAPVNYFDPNDVDQLYTSFNKQIETGDFTTLPDTTGPNKDLWKYAQDFYKWKEDGSVVYNKENLWGKYLARIDKDGAWGTIRQVVEDGKYELNRFHGMATNTMTERRATLDKLTEETYVKMVMGEMPISGFEEYTKNWLSLGGQETIDEVNEWYQENK